MLDMYAAYLAEKENKMVLSHSHSFVTYQLQKDCLYIDLLFTHKENRSKGDALALVQQLREKHAEYSLWACEVKLGDANAEVPLSLILKFGFKPVTVNQERNSIILLKEW
jgi:predicted GNAT superfamily acetyltransferase